MVERGLMQGIPLEGQNKRVTRRNKIQVSRTGSSNAEKILRETAGNKLNRSEALRGESRYYFGAHSS